MPATEVPPVRQMIREAVEALGSPTTNVAVKEWIEATYPGTNPSTIQQHLLYCCVNQPSRIRQGFNKRPRTATDPRYDFLFAPSPGCLERYRPEQHGVWSIEHDADGQSVICRKGDQPVYPEARGRTSQSNARRSPDTAEDSRIGTPDEAGDDALDLPLAARDDLESPPFVRLMLREAVEYLGSPTTNVAVRDWIESRYQGTNRETINAQRIICTVNQPSRVHYPQGTQPRTATDPRYDFLYSQNRGQLEWYRPERHGLWSIEQDEEDEFAICCDGGALIYPAARGVGRGTAKQKTSRPPRITPVTQHQIDAANALHHRLIKWAATDRAFERLGRHLGWDHEGCILKAAAINDLYSTRVYAIWRMAEHLMNVMVTPPNDPATLVEAIASLPGDDGSVPRQHWSFASKIGHFFIDGDRYPIYDSFCREMIASHLGRGGCVTDRDNPYRAFITNLECLREASGLSATLRDLDRYLWLTGQYRELLDKGEGARLNSELRSLFEEDDPEIQRLLDQLWPGQVEVV